MPDTVIRRLSDLGVPAAFHAEIMVRRAPRFHTLLHLTIILASLAASVAAIVVWSRHVDAAAENAAKAAHAALYDSDIGAESLGLLFTCLLAASWFCGVITWRRGSEMARNGWAADLMQEPAKHKDITDWLWRQMIRRYTAAAVSADGFLDLLGRGIVRDLGFTAIIMLMVTAVLGGALPAHVSYATDTAIADHPLLPLARDTVWRVANARTVISGCPNLPKDGSTLVYRLRFADGTEPDLGAWHPFAGSRLAALEGIAAHVPSGAARERFANPMRSDPLAPECLLAFGRAEGAEGIDRLLRLLGASEVEKSRFKGLR